MRATFSIVFVTVLSLGFVLVDGSPCLYQPPSWTYLLPPNLTEVVPSTGQAGSIVTLRGHNLLGGGSQLSLVQLAGVTVESIQNYSDTEIVVVAAPFNAPRNGSVLVQADSGALIESQDRWRYAPPGVIQNVHPSYGQGGTFVTLRGQKLLSSGSNIIVTTIAGIPAKIQSANDSVILLRAAPSATRLGPIVVTADNNVRITSSSNWTYHVPGSIAAAAPSSGVLGTKSYIFGTNLFGWGSRIETVSLANVSATILEQNNQYVRVVVQSGPPNIIGDIVITSDSGAQVVRQNGFKFVDLGVITEVVPPAGITNTLVTIKGNNLLSGGETILQVRMAGVSANVLDVNNSYVIVQAGAAEQPGLSGDIVLSIDTGPVVRRVNGWRYEIVQGQAFSLRSLRHSVQVTYSRFNLQLEQKALLLLLKVSLLLTRNHVQSARRQPPSRK